MRLSIRLLMHIYQGASLHWSLNADVLVTGAHLTVTVSEGLHVNHKQVYRISHLYVDDFQKECLTITVAFGISAGQANPERI
ncbi:hypothetical protein VL10_12855 [Leclercia adecarboxylata]|nr:hypothetical protein VL10_12855 [Leclercia adecarboxylata]KMN61316.1 hypothetical protein VK95_23375 [Leclercia sp. LK8]